MDSEHMWKATAIVLCAAVPAGFYVLGDLTDAFPGVLTIEPEETEPAAGPPAQAGRRGRAPRAVPTGPGARSSGRPASAGRSPAGSRPAGRSRPARAPPRR